LSANAARFGTLLGAAWARDRERPRAKMLERENCILKEIGQAFDNDELEKMSEMILMMLKAIQKYRLLGIYIDLRVLF
jgi:hypothetical protein